MDFDKAVAAFQRKNRASNMADQKRETYRAMIREYTSMKYAPAKDGVRKKREVTQDKIDRRAKEKAESSVDQIVDIAKFIDIDFGGME